MDEPASVRPPTHFVLAVPKFVRQIFLLLSRTCSYSTRRNFSFAKNRWVVRNDLLRCKLFGGQVSVPSLVVHSRKCIQIKWNKLYGRGFKILSWYGRRKIEWLCNWIFCNAGRPLNFICYSYKYLNSRIGTTGSLYCHLYVWKPICECRMKNLSKLSSDFIGFF